MPLVLFCAYAITLFASTGTLFLILIPFLIGFCSWGPGRSGLCSLLSMWGTAARLVLMVYYLPIGLCKIESVSSHLILCRVFAAFFTSSHLISSFLPFSQLSSADHSCCHLFSCHLSFSCLISLISSPFRPSQLLHSTHLVST